MDARVAELVDALVLGTSALWCGGSTPPSRTIFLSLTILEYHLCIYLSSGISPDNYLYSREM